MLMQAGEEPIELSAAEKARQQAVESGDTEAAADAEMQIVVALLRSQFGSADIDHQAGIIFLRVSRAHHLSLHPAHGRLTPSATLHQAQQKSFCRDGSTCLLQ